MKIVDHAVRGKDREIIGYMTGLCKDGIYYILDAVEIPIIGTDSRVEIAGQLGDKAHEYTADMKNLLEKIGKSQSFIGWYHSHPGFSCWLSGIDCKTQQTLQMAYKTFCAIVIDPYKTIANRKVEIGVFRGYNEEQKGLIADDFDVPKNHKAVIIKMFT
jgi:COP9 signalosome complex subunit 5